MTANVASTSPSDQSLAHSTISGPLSSRALFWRPRFLTGTSFVHHLPFAFWLADVCRPERVVETGIEDGQCYFGFCQAIDKLSISAMCTGYGTWEAEAAVPTRLVDHNVENYSDFSELARLGAVEALKGADAHTLDLLIINVGADLGDCDLFLDLAAQKMSGRGIILFYNLAEKAGAKAEALTRFCSGYKTIQFLGNDGLILALIGKAQDDRLLALAAMKVGSPEFNAVQTVFRRLGSGHYYEWRSRSDSAAAQKAQEAAQAIRAALEEANSKYQALELAYQERSKQIALAQAGQYDLQQEREAMATELAAAKAAADSLTAELRAEQEARETAQTAARQARSNEAAVKLQLEDRFQDLAALARELERLERIELKNTELEAEKVRLLEDCAKKQAQAEALAAEKARLLEDSAGKQAQAEALAAEKAKLLKDIAKKEAQIRLQEETLLASAAKTVEQSKEIASIEQKLARAEAQVEKLLGSSSWKITSPLRSLIKAVRK